ncbi:glycosyltransferase [Pedobacter sp.]|uniref:glycosyltransferase n=1 Tax=Pedobacter sp. TaxID=1411316 RepID=UPI003D7FB3EA
MHKIKIVHIIGSLSRGGAERFVIDLCNEIAKKEKYEVYILSLCGNDSQQTFVNEINPNVNYLSFNKKKGFNLSVLFQLTRWLKDKNPHIVHSHLNSFEYLSVYRFYKSRTAFFHTIHNTAEMECPNHLVKYFRKILYKHNDVIPITISVNGSKTYREYYKLSNEIRIENARPHLNLTEKRELLFEKYKRGNNNFLLLHIGRISIEKNQELLIKTVKRFNVEEERKCKLLIIGDVQDAQLNVKLKKIAAEDLNIEFVGGINNVADYLSFSDAFCLSSTAEGMPISLIEAMSVGCIPICTPVGGMKEMIKDGETGFLSKDLQLDSYLETLKKVVYHQNKEAVKQNIMNIFKNKYHIEVAAVKHLNTYNKSLNLFEGRDSAFELLYKSKF